MNKNIAPYSYLVSFIFSVIGALMKIQHYPFSEVFLSLGIIALIIFIIAAIIEVSRSRKISDSEKFMWKVGFIVFGSIAGLVYLVSGRKRIV